MYKATLLSETFAGRKFRGWASLIEFAGIKFPGWQKFGFNCLAIFSEF